MIVHFTIPNVVLIYILNVKALAQIPGSRIGLRCVPFITMYIIMKGESWLSG